MLAPQVNSIKLRVRVGGTKNIVVTGRVKVCQGLNHYSVTKTSLHGSFSKKNNLEKLDQKEDIKKN